MNVRWLDSFELGVPEIDSDHKTIVRLMKLVEDSVTANYSPRTTVALIDRLFAYTRDHFRREEEMLKSWGYEEIDKHSGYHGELMDSAEEIKAACLKAAGEDDFQECCSELMRFLIDDVVRGDMKLKSFLQYSGVTVSP
jgi:hemerythrin